LAIESFDKNDLLRIGNQVGLNIDGVARGAFTNILGTVDDPTTVTMQVAKPSGTILTYGWPTAGVDGTLTRESLGRFYFDVLVDESGYWSWNMGGTGVVQTAQEGVFYARVSAFV